MNASDLILAIALIAAEPGTEVQPIAATRFEAVRDAVKDEAVRRELLDPREARYWFGDPDSFPLDLDVIRMRARSLSDAPMLADGSWLPGPGVSGPAVTFNREFRTNIARRIPWEQDRAALYEDVIGEADRLYAVWGAVLLAGTDAYYVTFRRQSMRLVRDLIGSDAWARMELPQPVPVHRFRPA